MPVSKHATDAAQLTASASLRAGEATEAAFRARHRWAARRVAHLLKGLPDTPPLQAASEVIESASVNVGLKVDGQPFLGSTVDIVSASGGLTGDFRQSYTLQLPCHLREQLALQMLQRHSEAAELTCTQTSSISARGFLTWVRRLCNICASGTMPQM